MDQKRILPRPYPWTNPDNKELKSRFAKQKSRKDDQGNDVKEIVLEAVQPQLPVCEFELDKKTGRGKFVPVPDENGQPLTRKGNELTPYIPSPDLVELVRLAQVLQRPILIKGEPGSGKTQLAKSVAYEWYGDDYINHFFEWPVKSTSKAADGLYSFDYLARLREAQLENIGESSGDKKGAETDMRKYRKFGPMGKAFLTSTEENPSILLIDEIDKADIDFPNDLLLELDERRFTIPASETGEVIQAEFPPVIFITSNDERELPEAFLRRCLFMYVKFPEDSLLDIIKAHMPVLVEDHSKFVLAAIERFKRLRKDIEADPADNKRVSTSELLDWLKGFNYDSGAGIAISEASIADFPLYHQALLKTYAAISREKQAQSPKNG
ncbi:MAG TPA: MoxR family ATPase [Puia sp.]|nr:MoxR family ATPase [Puia sp.]